jgi:DNA repair exonuclease SbcCD ATPase subunit
VICFTAVKYKNFLGSGNHFTEIVLNEHRSTLIVGRNGVGKSTVSEAICFALFGRPLRDVPKHKLVNSINKSDCVVELQFKIGSVAYRIKRGMKPQLFEIYENDNLIPAPAAVVDYQTLLESTILHLNHKSFKQVVVLGSASYVPFMRLTATNRRDIIEDLLDIEVFSSMNALTKDDAQTVKVDLEKCGINRVRLLEQRKMAASFVEHMAEQRQALIDKIEDDMLRQKNEQDVILHMQRDLTTSLESYAPVREQLQTLRDKRDGYRSKLTTITNVVKKVQKERAFYEEHDSCPTCEQAITEGFKEARFAEFTKKESDASKASTQCEALIRRYQGEAQACEQSLQETVDIERRLHELHVKLELVHRRMKDLRVSLADAQTPVEPPKTTLALDDIDQQLSVVEAEHATLSTKRVIIDAASLLLKDNGIKARIVKHYLPIINKTINHYLTAMDFPILFELNEEFEETLKSRHRDEFEYNLFSEGEKKRIDLALLLTWRAVAKMKNSANTNLLILDEVFDSSLDASGTEEFLKIIAALETDTSVWVISHKGDQLVDKFSHTLAFEKVRGFSCLKA